MSHNGFFLGTWLSLQVAGFSTSALCNSLAHSEAITLPSLFIEHSEAITLPSLFIEHSEFSDFIDSFPGNGSSSLFVHLECKQPHNGPQLPPVDRHLHFVVLHRDFLLQEQQIPSPALSSLLTLFSFELLISGVFTFVLTLLSSEIRG
jgi:hypothetical protein